MRWQEDTALRHQRKIETNLSRRLRPVGLGRLIFLPLTRRCFLRPVGRKGIWGPSSRARLRSFFRSSRARLRSSVLSFTCSSRARSKSSVQSSVSPRGRGEISVGFSPEDRRPLFHAKPRIKNFRIMDAIWDFFAAMWI